jgi:hypothetical protein
MSKCHDSFMTEEQIVERFEEIQGEIDVYTKRIETLEEDVKILAKFATSQSKIAGFVFDSLHPPRTAHNSRSITAAKDNRSMKRRGPETATLRRYRLVAFAAWKEDVGVSASSIIGLASSPGCRHLHAGNSPLIQA